MADLRAVHSAALRVALKAAPMAVQTVALMVVQ
jgi:hypothetical protein